MLRRDQPDTRLVDVRRAKTGGTDVTIMHAHGVNRVWSADALPYQRLDTAAFAVGM